MLLDPNGIVHVVKENDVLWVCFQSKNCFLIVFIFHCYIIPICIITVDRGFRDVVKCLEDKNLKVFMHNILRKKQKFDAIESNQSRTVTIVR